VAEKYKVHQSAPFKKFEHFLRRGVPRECFPGPHCGTRRPGSDCRLRRIQSDATNDQWASRASPSVVGWRVRVSVVALVTDPLDGAYCDALLLADWSVRQKLNHVSSVQISYVALYSPLCAIM